MRNQMSAAGTYDASVSDAKLSAANNVVDLKNRVCINVYFFFVQLQMMI